MTQTRWKLMLLVAIVLITGGGTLALSHLSSMLALATHLTGLPATYTLDADFDEGVLNNVNHVPSDQLQLSDVTDPFGFIWIAVSTKGTTVKIDTETGAVLGEYWTSPDGRWRDPSRTTVDLNGNVWVTNRAEGDFVPHAAIQSVAGGDPLDVPPEPFGSGMGSMTHIGLEEANQCVDRNGNGVIDTSTGLGDVLAWPNDALTTDDDYGKLDKNSLNAVDECIIHYTRVNSTGTRHVSVNTANDVWASGTGDRDFDLVDGATGKIIQQAGSVGWGGYGGLITGPTGAEVIWSAGPLLRWPVANPLAGGVDGVDYTRYFHDAYGLCVDPSGNVWNTSLSGNVIHKFSAAGALLGSFPHGNFHAQGCVADGNGDIWVAHSLIGGSTVGHLLNDGTFVGTVAVGNGPTGVAVDSAGKVWATNYYDGTASRIDPALGPIGGGGASVGAVDLTTVFLGGNLYNYSDMTGSTLSAPPNSGLWTVVHDSGAAGTAWGVISWTGSTPGDSSLTVTVASSPDGVVFGPSQVVTSGSDLTVADNQYLKVTVNFSRATTAGTPSPILYDLTLNPEAQPSAEGRMTGGGSIGSTGARHGFELHCDVSSVPNRLEVNWGKGNKFHLESLTSAACSDDPSIAPHPPVAGFDTYTGKGVGRFNGVAGATAEWTFTDAGEPGKQDYATIVIKDAGGAPVLSASGKLANGNHQAHAE